MYLDGGFDFRDATLEESFATPAVPATPLSEEGANAAVRDWLAKTGLTGQDQFSVTVIRFRDVLVESVNPEDQVLDRPSVSFNVSSTGAVHTASGSWASIEDEASYPLHPAERLLSDLREARGVFGHLRNPRLEVGTDQDAAPEADYTKDASATVERVEVAYTRAADAGGQPYLVPIYVVEGRMTQTGLARPAPFITWVPALEGVPIPSLPREGGGGGGEQAPNELFAVARTLPVFRGTGQEGSPPVTVDFLTGGGPGLERTSSLTLGTFILQEEEAAVLDFYQRELAADGWQPEEPPTVNAPMFWNADPLPEPQQEPTIASFITGEFRVAIMLWPNEPPDVFARVFLNIVVEPR